MYDLMHHPDGCPPSAAEPWTETGVVVSASVIPESDQGAVSTLWYQLSPEEVAARLDVDPERGLSKPEVERRRVEHGSNVLDAKKAESGLQAFLRQYEDLMQIILVGA